MEQEEPEFGYDDLTDDERSEIDRLYFQRHPIVATAMIARRQTELLDQARRQFFDKIYNLVTTEAASVSSDQNDDNDKADHND